MKNKKIPPSYQKVVDYLRSIAPVSAQPKQIAFEIGEDKDVIRVYCNRLYKQKIIEKDLRGWYRALFTLEDIMRTESPEMRLHGIKLEGSAVTEIEQVLLTSFLQSHPIEEASGNRKMYKLGFEGRVVTLLLSQDGHIEIFLKSTKYPIDYVTFERFVGFLDGLFGGKLPLLSLKVVQLGIGRDFREWQLEGVKSIKISAWRNAWAQIYQHTKEEMRVELHIKDRVTLGDAIHILRAMSETPPPPVADNSGGMFR